MDQSPSEAFPQKLTQWAKEPTLLVLKNDLELANQSHSSQMTKIQRWNDLIKVEGSQKPKTIKGRSSVQPKLIRRQAEWRYSALTEPFTGADKLFSVKPRTFEDAEAARQNELVINWQFDTKINKVKFIDDYVRATVDEGTVIVRTGWDRVTVMVDTQVPVYAYYPLETEEQAQQLQQAIELKAQDPRKFSEEAPAEIQAAVEFYEQEGQPAWAQVTGSQTTKIEKAIVNKPILEVLNPANVKIDPTCGGDLDKALFVIYSFETNYADLIKQGKRYKNLDKVNWDSNAPITNPEHETNTPDTFQFNDKSRKKVVAYEYWGFYDIHDDGTLVPIVATWIGDVLIRMEENPYPDQKLPFVLVPYLPIKRELYGEPDAELLEDNQKILGAVSRGMIDLLGRSANAQRGFAKGMLDPLNRRRYDNGQDYEFNPNTNPQGGMIEHKYPELPQSALVMLNLQNQEAEALTGVKSFGGGISGEAYGDVAAGIRGVLDAASKREMAILRRLAKGITEIGQKIIAMNAVFLSEEEVIRVTNKPYIETVSMPAQDMMGHNGGPKLEDEFITIRREDLQGNFDLKVDISTAEIDDAQAKDLTFMLQTIGNTLDPSFTTMLLAEIARLKKMPELEQRLRTWKPEPDPLAEQLKQLQVEEQQLKNEELRSQIELNKAKAKQAEATADKTNLEFVEQESGTQHEREMEKQRGQSQGNQNLQITKALTTPRKEGEKDPDIEAAVGFNELSNGTRKVNGENPTPIVDNILERDELAGEDPRYSLGSRFFDPSLDPSLNPNSNL